MPTLIEKQEQDKKKQKCLLVISNKGNCSKSKMSNYLGT